MTPERSAEYSTAAYFACTGIAVFLTCVLTGIRVWRMWIEPTIEIGD